MHLWHRSDVLSMPAHSREGSQMQTHPLVALRRRSPPRSPSPDRASRACRGSVSIDMMYAPTLRTPASHTNTCSTCATAPSFPRQSSHSGQYFRA